MKKIAALCLLLSYTVVNAAPAGDVTILESRLKELQAQIASVQQEIAQEAHPQALPAVWSNLNNEQQQQDSFAPQKRMAAWQPMKRNAADSVAEQNPLQKRMAAWQPMKRSNTPLGDKEQLIRLIEGRLGEILRAGEKLGVTADEVLNHLRMQNALENGM